MDMEKQKGLINIEERDIGDIDWNGFPVEEIRGKKLKNVEKIFNVSDDLQNVFTRTSKIPLKKLIDKGREIYKNFLESLDIENYKAKRGETKIF